MSREDAVKFSFSAANFLYNGCEPEMALAGRSRPAVVATQIKDAQPVVKTEMGASEGGAAPVKKLAKSVAAKNLGRRTD